MGLNTVILHGNLTRDPEVRVLEFGERKTSVVNFTVATSRYFKKSNGEKGQETTFVDCEAWDTGAETIGQFLTKGSAIIVRGALKNDNWEDKDGNKRSSMKVRVMEFDMERKRTSEPKPEQEQPDAEDSDAADAAEAARVAEAEKLAF